MKQKFELVTPKKIIVRPFGSTLKEALVVDKSTGIRNHDGFNVMPVNQIRRFSREYNVKYITTMTVNGCSLEETLEKITKDSFINRNIVELKGTYVNWENTVEYVLLEVFYNVDPTLDRKNIIFLNPVGANIRYSTPKGNRVGFRNPHTKKVLKILNEAT